MSSYSFITPHYTDQTWMKLRQALYHYLNLTYNQDEMRFVFENPEREVYIIYDGNYAIGMLELALRNFVMAAYLLRWLTWKEFTSYRSISLKGYHQL